MSDTDSTYDPIRDIATVMRDAQEALVSADANALSSSLRRLRTQLGIEGWSSIEQHEERLRMHLQAVPHDPV